MLGVTWYTAFDEPTLSDSFNNNWTGLTVYDSGTYGKLRLYYVVNPTRGLEHTFTLAGTATYPSITVHAFTGTKATSPFDQQNGGANTGTTIQPGSVTPSEDNELVICGVSDGQTSGTYAIDLGFTMTDSLGTSVGSYIGSALAYLIETTAAAKNPTWTRSASNAMASAIATFKVAASTSDFFPAWAPAPAPRPVERLVWAGIEY